MYLVTQLSLISYSTCCYCVVKVFRTLIFCFDGCRFVCINLIFRILHIYFLCYGV
jgi:hypothetical protein